MGLVEKLHRGCELDWKSSIAGSFPVDLFFVSSHRLFEKRGDSSIANNGKKGPSPPVLVTGKSPIAGGFLIALFSCCFASVTEIEYKEEGGVEATPLRLGRRSSLFRSTVVAIHRDLV